MCAGCCAPGCLLSWYFYTGLGQQTESLPWVTKTPRPKGKVCWLRFIDWRLNISVFLHYTKTIISDTREIPNNLHWPLCCCFRWTPFSTPSLWSGRRTRHLTSPVPFCLVSTTRILNHAWTLQKKRWVKLLRPDAIAIAWTKCKALCTGDAAFSTILIYTLWVYSHSAGVVQFNQLKEHAFTVETHRITTRPITTSQKTMANHCKTRSFFTALCEYTLNQDSSASCLEYYVALSGPLHVAP